MTSVQAATIALTPGIRSARGANARAAQWRIRAAMAQRRDAVPQR